MGSATIRSALAACALKLLAAGAGASGNEACLACHEVDLSASVHPGHACVDCHADLKGKDLPHEPPKPAECAACHGDVAARQVGSLHAMALARGDELAPRCQSCHGAHDILPRADPRSRTAPIRIPFMCGGCHREGAKVQKQRKIHQDHIFENYSESLHAEGLLRKGLAVSANCASCHTAHEILPHTDPRSSIHRGNVTATCTKCHAIIEEVHRKVIEGKLWEKEPHAIPVCVDCHQPHRARKVFYDQGMADKDCLMCHSRKGLKSPVTGRSLHVERSHLRGSVHENTACAKCHTGGSPEKERACETITGKVDCSVCHSEEVKRFQGGVHGRLLGRKDPNAPSCAECHGTHAVMGKADSRSPTFPTNVPALCAKCHRESEKAAVRYRGRQHNITVHYQESIHGKGLLKSGLVVTATCTSCHTAHGVLPADDPGSSIHRNNVARTCGECHHGIFEEFEESIHSPAVSRTDKELPVCSDCHTAHTIKRTDVEGFRVGIMERCGRCHEETARTYFDTYHGKVSQLGYGKTAKCHDCHGAHGILPPSEPKSTLSRWNVVETCQKCHPGANRRFAGYFTHATHHDQKKYPWLFWSFWGMTALLVGTFSFFTVHTLLWLPRAYRMRKARGAVRPGPGKKRVGEKQVLRFTRLERALHVVMVVSFLVLAVTGMSLKFSYTGWASYLSHALGGFESAGYLHRFFALVMFGVFLMHLWSLWRRHRWNWKSWRSMLLGPGTMIPNRRDLEEFGATMKWFLGRGVRPAYGRWTYWEKFDYFAVFWGIAIIGSTGLFLWFPELFTRILPGWAINVATIVHSDEALLAAGFIFTVHFFNTHFRPDKFPMDMVIFTGSVPVEEMRHDRPGEYRELEETGELKRRLVDGPAVELVRTARIFGWIALSTGLLMAAAIMYAMIFAYR